MSQTRPKRVVDIKPVLGPRGGQAVDLTPKVLQILKEAVPHTARVAYLIQSSIPTRERYVRDLDSSAPMLGLRSAVVLVQGPEDLADRLGNILADRPDALIVHGGPLAYGHMAEILGFAARHRLPTAHDDRAFVLAGGLLSYAPNYADLFDARQCMSTRSSRAPSPLIFPSSNPQSSSW
jgi:putative ABC transport system substrate-binding protein